MNVGEWILKRALNHPHLPMVKAGNRTLDNQGFNARINRTAKALVHRGLKKGDRLALLAENSIEFLEVLFACAKAGVVLAPLSPQLTALELGHILKDSTPKVLAYGPETTGRLEELRPNLPEATQPLPLTLEADSALASLSIPADDQEPAGLEDIGLDDPYLIIYLPGPSGDFRGSVLSHLNIIFGALNVSLGHGIDRTFRSLVVAPMSHIGALSAAIFPVVYSGGSLVLKSFYNPADVLETIVREGINHMFAVPVMFQMLTRTPEWPEADFSHVRCFVSGGAPMPVAVIQKYQEEKNISFVQGYGMTETGRLTSLDIEDSWRKAGSVGKEVWHVFLKIVDDRGREVPAGEIGEIVVRGPNVFQGYWNRPEDNAAAFTGSWFHTGDLGRRDEEGFIFLEGRKIETIISSGRNIYPAEVERALTALAGVKEAVVVGLPDPVKGQVVGAAVAPREGFLPNKEELLQGLQDRLALYKIPKKLIIMESLPRNPAGQVSKEEVKGSLA
ncbi:MAG: AMP-binding protein [Thermodesulfobacteriota bacterium]